MLGLCGVRDEGPLTVLQLGAGDGWTLRYQRPGLVRIAVDAADSYAGELAAQGIAFHTCDIARQRLPAENSPVALVMMNHVIEHIADPTHVLASAPSDARAHGFSPRVMLASDYTRISLDLLTGGCIRPLLFRRRFLGVRVGGAEIEASFRRD